MKKIITILLFSFIVVPVLSRGFISHDSTRFSLAGGFSFTTSNIKRDIGNRPHPGVDAKLQVFLTPAVRLSVEGSYNFKHNLDLRWVDVESHLLELNLHYIASINNNKAGFYLIGGFALQNWKGIYTGIGHEYEFRQYGSPQSYYSTSWPSFGMGVGLQRKIKKIELYGEFKNRLLLRKEENVPTSIIDVGYSFGARYNIKYKGNRKSIIKMPGDRYHWF